jgi:fatty-acid desaturase
MFAPSSIKIFIVQFLCWCTIPLFYYSANSFWIFLSIVFYIIYAGIGAGLTFHRTLSHNSWKFHPTIRKALIFFASMANIGSPLTWVAIHRAHHMYCDTDKDPHSPNHLPMWYVLFGTMFSKVSVKCVVDLLKDTYIVFVHRYYYLLQLPWIALLYFLGGWMAVIACHIVPGGLTWILGSFINYLNHTSGYRTYITNDTSKNNVLTGFLFMGEGWHNNHHKFPARGTTKHSNREFDMIYYMAKLLGGKMATS